MEELLAKANSFNSRTLMGSLGIVFTHVSEGYLEATMPVDTRTHQPYGLLHGGASAALAETLGSYGSHMISEPRGELSVGIELNINHMRGVTEGLVTGKARIMHAGRSTHVWSIEIFDPADRLISASRLTVMIRKRNDAG